MLEKFTKKTIDKIYRKVEAKPKTQFKQRPIQAMPVEKSQEIESRKE
jgi:hypothetical protein